MLENTSQLTRGERSMVITKDTRVSVILEEYGDIADVMEIFGVERVGRYSLRMFLAKALTVEWAAKVHRVPLAEFLNILNRAVVKKQGNAQ
ncbi:MAG: DUF1858 domain-containing protein [Anaerolineales bacterium]|nr:DUF1858 domain-containing protein [Anaerolineales bacterium]